MANFTREKYYFASDVLILCLFLTSNIKSDPILAGSDTFAIEGKSYTFICSGMSGNAVVWYKDLENIGTVTRYNGRCQDNGPEEYEFTCDKRSGSKYYVLIKSVDRKLHGISWYCVSPFGSDSSNKLVLQVNLPVTSVVIQPSQITVDKGNSSLFNCSTSNAGSRPEALIAWFRRYKDSKNKLITSQLTRAISTSKFNIGPPKNGLFRTDSILEYTPDVNDVEITCKARNKYTPDWVEVKSPTRLTVRYPPQNAYLVPPVTTYEVSEGQVIPEVKCMANCHPPCQFAWTRKDRSETMQNPLSLGPMNANTSGPYTCSIWNILNRDHPVEIEVDVIISSSKGLRSGSDDGAVAGGVVCFIFVAVIIVIIVVVFVNRKRRRRTHYAKGRKREDFKRSITRLHQSNEETREEMKRSITIIRQSDEGDGTDNVPDVYARIQKTTKTQTHENHVAGDQTDDENIKQNPSDSGKFLNKDGLVYTELSLERIEYKKETAPTDPVTPQVEDSTTYALINHTQLGVQSCPNWN